ncbi:MAG TPA: STAS/SEC14 domain-containing protein [Bacteroidia bacterium]|nr:STAS/SEC14 domain-containing protein [Bacteroidia bacterium]
MIESATTNMWFDDHGILCSIAKKHPPQTEEQIEQTMKDFIKLSGGRKLCMLADITDAVPAKKETRERAADEFPKHVKAIALLTRSPLSKMIANLFFALKPPTYPMKMFNDPEEGREWLKQYLKQE